MMEPVKIALFVFLLLGAFSCATPQRMKANRGMGDSLPAALTVTQLKRQLESSFKNGQPDSLKQFFLDWNQAVKPNSDHFINQNDTLRALFEIYKTFYKPFHLKKLGHWEWGNQLNAGGQYVVVQDKLLYSILSSQEPDASEGNEIIKDSIDHFRPPVGLSPSKVLYLTPEYKEALNTFLGAESTKLGEGGIMNPSRPAGESERRYQFLRSYIPILHGHWGGYWLLETHPLVSQIVFNRDLTKARIYFRVGYQGGESAVEKKGNAWHLKKSKATWIE